MTSCRRILSYRPKCTAQKAKACFPIVEWLPRYNLTKLRGDFIAGFAVGLMMIPQSLAHAVIAGLKPQYGLYSSFPSMLLYVFLGTSKDVSIGTTVITALLANRYSVTEDTHPNIAAALTFIVGIVMVVVALCRLGFVVRFLAFPVISGFVSASSIIISVSQLRYLFGLSKPKRQVFLKLKHFFENLKYARAGDVTMGLICLVFLLLLQHFSQRKRRSSSDTSKWKQIFAKITHIITIGRNALVAIIAIMVSYSFYAFGKADVFRTVGKLPEGLPSPEMPLRPVKLSANRTMGVGEIINGFGSGIGVLPLIIVLQSIAASKALGRMNKYKVDTFQEIVALGLGNIFGSFFKAIPMTASFSRSAVNSSSGSQTPIAGVFTSLVVILAIQFLNPVFSFAPMSSLAAIVIAAIIKLFDYQLAWKLWKLNKFDLAVWMVTFLGCLYEIEIGILAGVVLSLCLVMFREFNPRLCHVIDKEAKKLVITLNGGVWFPGIEAVANLIQRKLEEAGDSINVVVVDCGNMLEIDYTVIHGLREIEADCSLSHVELQFKNVRGKIKRMLEGEKLIKHQQVENGGHPLDAIETGKLIQNDIEQETPLVDSNALVQSAHVEDEAVA